MNFQAQKLEKLNFKNIFRFVLYVIVHIIKIKEFLFYLKLNVFFLEFNYKDQEPFNMKH